jgi:hypothetical protein
MPASKDNPLGHKVIVHGSTTIKATLHNDCKKPQQKVPHHLNKAFFSSHTYYSTCCN